MNKQHRNRLTDTENRLMAARRVGVGGLGEEGEGIRSTNGWSQDSREDVKHSAGTTVNNTVITMCGVRWALHLSGGSLRQLYKRLTTTLHTRN